jgi:hypothetical protein
MVSYVSNEWVIEFSSNSTGCKITSTGTTETWVVTNTVEFRNLDPPPPDIEERPHYLPVWVLGHLLNIPTMKKKEMYYTWARRRAM